MHGCTEGQGQRAITVHGDVARVHRKVQGGDGAEIDNGARGQCTGVGKGQGGDTGRCRKGQRQRDGDGARV